MGPPSTIIPESTQKQRWEYTYISNSQGSLTIFPFFHGDNQTQWTHKAVIEFQNSKVINIVADGNQILPNPEATWDSTNPP
jgi:hypothetical protein